MTLGVLFICLFFKVQRVGKDTCIYGLFSQMIKIFTLGHHKILNRERNDLWLASKQKENDHIASLETCLRAVFQTLYILPKVLRL